MRYLVILGLLIIAACSDKETTIIHMEDVTYGWKSIPNQGECVDLGDGVYIENEGAKADIYNNPDCDHGPAPKADYCNNVYEGHVCWVGKRQFSITGEYSTMIVNEVEYQ